MKKKNFTSESTPTFSRTPFTSDAPMCAYWTPWSTSYPRSPEVIQLGWAIWIPSVCLLQVFIKRTLFFFFFCLFSKAKGVLLQKGHDRRPFWVTFIWKKCFFGLLRRPKKMRVRMKWHIVCSIPVVCGRVPEENGWLPCSLKVRGSRKLGRTQGKIPY